jgi:inward rectifier potassium channel
MAGLRAPRTRPWSRRIGERPVVVLGAPSGLTDLYHWVLRIPIGGLLALIAGVYLVINLVFAALYLAVPGDITNVKPGDFADAFFFSVQTLSTVGYGAMSPVSFYANIIVTIECLVGLMLIAVTTGVIFARVSRPTARVVFGHIAMIAPFEGAPHLMVRAINERSNQILEAEVNLNLTRTVQTAEGHAWRRFYELPVTRRRSPLFALSWTIMHPLDERSPLFGATAESLAAENAEIIVVVSGVDDVFAQRVHARWVYRADEIVWGEEFEDVLTVSPDGIWVLDVRNFHKRRRPASKGPH